MSSPSTSLRRSRLTEEDRDSCGSIVEHHVAEDVDSEGPAWRHMTRSPTDVYTTADRASQTDDVEAMYALKARALAELEEDISSALQQQAALAQQSCPPSGDVAQLVGEVVSQRQAIDGLHVQVSYLTRLVEQLLLISSSTPPPGSHQ